MAQEMRSLRISARNGTVAVLYWYLPPSLDSCMRMPPEEVSTVSSTAPMAFCRSVGPLSPPLLLLLGDDACVGEAARDDACNGWTAHTPLSGASSSRSIRLERELAQPGSDDVRSGELSDGHARAPWLRSGGAQGLTHCCSCG
jgi:hypothetical protein